NLLERDADYQHLVSLFHNSSNKEDNAEFIFKCIYNISGPGETYINYIQTFIEKHIGADITRDPNKKRNISRYLAARFLTDVLIIRTRKDNLASRLGNPDSQFGTEEGLNLSPKTTEMLKPQLTSNGRLELSSLDQKGVTHINRELKAVEIKIEIISLLERSNGSLSEQEKGNLIDRNVETFIAGETEGVRKLERAFKTELEGFIENLLS